MARLFAQPGHHLFIVPIRHLQDIACSDKRKIENRQNVDYAFENVKPDADFLGCIPDFVSHAITTY